MGGRRKQPEDYRALANKQSIQWAGPFVDSVSTKTNWICPNQHQWLARYRDIQQGKGCPVCSHRVPLTPQDYHSLAKKQGIQWLGPVVPDNNTRTTWQCGCGYQWTSKYKNIQRRPGCPACKGGIKKTAQDYHTIAKMCGFTWLGAEVPNVSTKTKWQCGHDHQWEATYSSLQQGYGCPTCSGKKHKISQDYAAIAKSRNWTWLGPAVATSRIKTEWRCEYGHKWKVPYTSVQQGYGCPLCAGNVNGIPTSQVQRNLRDLLGGELNFYTENYYIDIVIFSNDLKIAVEYDGWYYHQSRLEEDAERDDHLISLGWKVLRVKSGKYLPTTKQLARAIDQLLDGAPYVEIVLKDWGRQKVG